MDIKEIALNVAQATNLHYIVTSEKHTNDDWNIRFATALLAEVQKQNEPVAWRDGETGFVSRLRGGKQWQPLYLSPSFDTLPPSVEAIENKVAEACGEFVKCGDHEYDPLVIARKLSEGEWRKHMKGE